MTKVNTKQKRQKAISLNPVLSPAFLQSLDWWQLYKVAEPLVAKISVEKLHEGTRITIDQAKERTVLFSEPKIFHQAKNMPF